MLVIAVVFGAFLGGCLRAFFSNHLNRSFSFPMGTLLANLLGSIVIGLVIGLAIPARSVYDALWATGFCGGLTTFSTFSLESYHYFQEKKVKQAVLYWLGSVALSLMSVYLGLTFAKLI